MNYEHWPRWVKIVHGCTFPVSEPARLLELARLRKENEQLRQDLSHAKAMTEVWMNRARKAEAVPYPMPDTENAERDDDCSCGGGDISGHDVLCPYAASINGGEA